MHTEYHPLKHHPLEHRPLMIGLGWCTVEIIVINIVLLGSCCAPSLHYPKRTMFKRMISTKMVHSGFHPLKHRPLRIVLGWCTVDIILLNIVLL